MQRDPISPSDRCTPPPRRATVATDHGQQVAVVARLRGGQWGAWMRAGQPPVIGATPEEAVERLADGRPWEWLA